MGVIDDPTLGTLPIRINMVDEVRIAPSPRQASPRPQNDAGGKVECDVIDYITIYCLGFSFRVASAQRGFIVRYLEPVVLPP